LFRETYVDYADSRLRFTTAPVPDELVSRLHLVAVTSDNDILVCRSQQEWRFLPGGTREPGEDLSQLAARELAEEAGARLLTDPRYVGAHAAVTARAAPFRPHLPHPLTYWAYATAAVERTGEPSNPTDGEQVVEVRQLPPEQAAAYLEHHDPMHADVIRLAQAMGLEGQPVPLRSED